jgi:hypothetical protein
MTRSDSDCAGTCRTVVHMSDCGAHDEKPRRRRGSSSPRQRYGFETDARGAFPRVGGGVWCPALNFRVVSMTARTSGPKPSRPALRGSSGADERRVKAILLSRLPRCCRPGLPPRFRRGGLTSREETESCVVRAPRDRSIGAAVTGVKTGFYGSCIGDLAVKVAPRHRPETVG